MGDFSVEQTCPLVDATEPNKSVDSGNANRVLFYTMSPRGERYTQGVPLRVSRSAENRPPKSARSSHVRADRNESQPGQSFRHRSASFRQDTDYREMRDAVEVVDE